jgi:hypothetical protein
VVDRVRPRVTLALLSEVEGQLGDDVLDHSTPERVRLVDEGLDPAPHSL